MASSRCKNVLVTPQKEHSPFCGPGERKDWYDTLYSGRDSPEAAVVRQLPFFSAVERLRPPPVRPLLQSLFEEEERVWDFSDAQLEAHRSLHLGVAASYTRDQLATSARLASALRLFEAREDGGPRWASNGSSKEVLIAVGEVLEWSEMDRLRARNPKLLRHVYSPNEDLGTVHCDDAHKRKNLAQGVANQAKFAEEDGEAVAATWPLRLANVRKTASKPEHAVLFAGQRAYVDKAHDQQYTRLYDGLFAGEAFKREMLKDGHITDVLCLDAVVASQMAWVMAGLTQAERTARLFMFQFWASALWGDALFIPGPRGVNSKNRVQGLVPNNILEMMANADGRALFLNSCSDAEAKLYVEKAFSNDVVEGLHSDLVVRAGGYKPDPAVCEMIFNSIDALAGETPLISICVMLGAKMLSHNEFWIPMSAKKNTTTPTPRRRSSLNGTTVPRSPRRRALSQNTTSRDRPPW